VSLARVETAREQLTKAGCSMAVWYDKVASWRCGKTRFHLGAQGGPGEVTSLMAPERLQVRHGRNSFFLMYTWNMEV